MTSYDIVVVQRFQVLRDGQPVTDFYPVLHATRAAAERAVGDLQQRDAAAVAKQQRVRAARGHVGKWTPASLRAAMTRPHWEVMSLDLEYPVDGFAGRYRCTWRELDPKQPYDQYGGPNYDIYGTTWIVDCHDQPDRNDVQFSCARAGDSREPYTYVTVDHLAAALIRRGLLDLSPPQRTPTNDR